MSQVKNHNLIELPEKELEALSETKNMRSFIRKYKLTAKFCVERVLFDDSLTGEDTYICNKDVLYWQKHISEKELEEEAQIFFKTHTYDCRIEE